MYTLASGIQGFKTLAAGMLQKKIIIPKFFATRNKAGVNI